MEITAYDTAKVPTILGTVAVDRADQIWAKALKSTSRRSLEPVFCYESPAPTIVDNVGTSENFSFRADRSFGNSAISPGQALALIAKHRAAVPRLCAAVKFVQTGTTIWLVNCGITGVDVAEKNGAYIGFDYTVIGGSWSLINPLTT